MIINKETKKKLRTIVKKMSLVGLGSVEELTTEINQRYIVKQIELEGL